MPSVLAAPPYGIATRNAWQPPSGQQLAIDWRHPLTLGLAGCVLLVGQRAFALADLTAPVPGALTVGSPPRPLGPGARFTANGQYLKKTMSFNGTGSYTLDAWVRITGPTTGVFFGLNNGADSHGYDLGIGNTNTDNSGSNLFLLDEAHSFTNAGVVPSNQWVHVCYTRTTTPLVTVYLNGRSVTTSGSGFADVSATTWIVGAETTTTRTFLADIAAARIWNRTLTQSEVAQLAADPFGMFVLPAPASPLFFLATTANSLSRSTSDAANGTDAVTRALALPRSLTDTAAGGAALARSLSLARATNDTAAGTDTPTRASSKSRSTSDAAAGTDGASRVVQLARTLVDAATGSDVVQRVLRLFRTTTDTGGGTDSATIPGSFRDIEYKLGAVTTKWHATASTTKWRAGPPAT